MAKAAKAPKNRASGENKGPSGPPGENLAAFLINAGKINDSLQATIAGKDASITLTDWLLLQALRSEGPLHASKIAMKVGITRQRVHQQIAPLKNAGVLELIEKDDKRNILSITPGGAELVQRYEDKFMALLSADPQLTPALMLRSAHAVTRRILRVLTKVPKVDTEKS
jgi:DNA-binding MarR family transcriptional regulator